MKGTWEKIFEYASMPVHGTMSRKLRKGVALQINEGVEIEDKKTPNKSLPFSDEFFSTTLNFANKSIAMIIVFFVKKYYCT